MPRNLSNESLEMRFVQGINGLVKKQKQTRANQMVLPSWTAPTFANSWVNYGAPYRNAGYLIDGMGMVHLSGVVKSGTVGAAIFTLPSGYRPLATILVPIASNGAFGTITIDTSGNVTCSVGSNISVSLDGIMFETT